MSGKSEGIEMGDGEDLNMHQNGIRGVVKIEDPLWCAHVHTTTP